MTLDITEKILENVKILPTTEIQEIAQNVAMIIATTRGTVPMDRTFGTDGEIIDQPIAIGQARLSAAIATAIREQEPRARVQKIFYSGDAEDGQLTATARIEIVEQNLRGYV